MARKEWFSASELAGIPGLPGDKSSINRKANKESWTRRQKSGVQGVAFEFHLSSLPEEAQIALTMHETDDIPSKSSDIDIECLTKTIEAIETLLDSNSKKLTPATKAKIIAILYRAAKNSNFIDIGLIKDTLELVA